MKLKKKRSPNPVGSSKNVNEINLAQINQFRKLSQLTDYGEFADEVESEWKKCEENFLDDNNSDNYKCIYCGNIFSHPLFVRQHLLATHLYLEPERYECLTCGKVVTELGVHLELHEKAFECTICGELSWNQLLDGSHRKQHETTTFACDICDINCVTIEGLQIHREFHEKYKNDAGDYIRLTPRVKRYQELCLAISPTKKKSHAEISCGFDTADGCIHFDTNYKNLNVYLNSKSCDTRDLAEYVDQFAES